ncbi:MAG: energy-coupling factor ABC transporter permease [Candidatus Krumholzibacteriia bacterium]
MHIPDGFLAPQVYGPAYGAAGVLWAVGLRRLRRRLDPAALPRLAVATAAAFALMLVTLPLPGGTTVHVSGVGMIAALFGVWQGFLALSLVFLMQALMFGDGGVTALPVNALAMGMGGSLAAVGVLRLAGRGRTGLFLAGWCGTVVPAVLVALVLGLQPLVARAADGTPLFFPFGWAVTLPAVVIPHLAVGVADGIVTVLAWRILAPAQEVA